MKLSCLHFFRARLESRKLPETGSGIYKAIEDNHVKDAGGQA